MESQHKLAGELIMRCFNLRTVAHVAHLKTTSYAQHVALNELYEGIIPLVDSFAEVYQGDFGVIDVYPTPPIKSGEALGEMNALSTWIESHRKSIGDTDSTQLQNIIDELLALLSGVRYKLRFLR